MKMLDTDHVELALSGEEREEFIHMIIDEEDYATYDDQDLYYSNYVEYSVDLDI